MCLGIAAFSFFVENAVSAELSASDQRLVRSLVSKYRSSRTTEAAKDEIVSQAIELGSDAVDILLPVIERELNPRLQRYRDQFLRQARNVAARRTSSVNPAEVASIRQAVLALKEHPNLTKEMIQQVGDPGLARLRELLLVPREEILDSSESLQQARNELLTLGQRWTLCVRVQYEALPPDNRPDHPPSFEEYLEGEEELVAGLASPMPDAARAVLMQNARLETRLDREEARTIEALNITRILLGLNPCVIDLRLCAAARDHSNDMKTLKFFDHNSPVPGKKLPWDRAKRFGTTASAENIAMGFHDGAAANMGWFHSPGHHKNMLGKHKRVGVGRVGSYYTEMFGN
ncbi:hypothetical protein JCM19992_14090 [Thermostilla marina]